MSNVKEKKSKPKAKPKPRLDPDSASRSHLLRLASQSRLAPFLCRYWPKSETGFKF